MIEAYLGFGCFGSGGLTRVVRLIGMVNTGRCLAIAYEK